MSAKTVLIAGATGLVGQAALEVFGRQPGTRVIALSRRRPEDLFGAEHRALDLRDRGAAMAVASEFRDATHVVFAALYERPDLIAGWRDPEQIRINDEMLRNLLDPLLCVARGLRHVALLQGTKAYGVHVRPMQVPAREGRSEARDIPNFYWNQEDYLRERQRGQAWNFTIFRPVLIAGFSLGSAMNLIPAIGVYGAILKARGEPLHYPGGPPRVAQVVDAGLLARAIAWAGEAPAARNATFNVANGDVFVWQNIWPAIADALGMPPGTARPCRMQAQIAPCEAEWAAIRARHGLKSPDLKAFVGLSFQYADYQLGTGRTEAAPASFSSTIKLMQAGFTEVMDSEHMFVRLIRDLQERRLLPPR
jgi:nucleoside-diphosphate-sugar epimerase